MKYEDCLKRGEEAGSRIAGPAPIARIHRGGKPLLSRDSGDEVEWRSALNY